MKWLTYLRIGRAVYRAIEPNVPQVKKVPVDDLLGMVEEVLTSAVTVETAPTLVKVRDQQQKSAPLG